MSDERLEALETLAGPVSRETYDALIRFETTFRRWAAAINLVSSSQLTQLWDRHILDSAQLLPLGSRALSWVDLGSGGGFPGAILALLLSERPGATMHLVEANGKKAAFLQAALSGYQSCTIHVARIEDQIPELEAPEIVTARALAPLRELFVLTEPWLSGTTKALFPKGREFGAELAEARDAWTFDLIEHRSRLNANGVILEVSNLRRRPRS